MLGWKQGPSGVCGRLPCCGRGDRCFDHSSIGFGPRSRVPQALTHPSDRELRTARLLNASADRPPAWVGVLNPSVQAAAARSPRHLLHRPRTYMSTYHRHRPPPPYTHTHQHTGAMSVVAKLWDGLRASYTKLVVAELNNYGAFAFLSLQESMCPPTCVLAAQARLCPWSWARHQAMHALGGSAGCPCRCVSRRGL